MAFFGGNKGKRQLRTVPPSQDICLYRRENRGIIHSGVCVMLYRAEQICCATKSASEKLLPYIRRSHGARVHED